MPPPPASPVAHNAQMRQKLSGSLCPAPSAVAWERTCCSGEWPRLDTARSTTQHSTAQHSIAQDSTGYHTQYTQHSTEVNAQPSERVNQLEVSQDRSRSVRVHAGVVTACASRAWNRVPSPRTSQACRHGVAQGKCSGRGEGTHCVRVYAYACVRAPRVCACVRAPCVGACVTGRGGGQHRTKAVEDTPSHRGPLPKAPT